MSGWDVQSPLTGDCAPDRVIAAARNALPQMEALLQHRPPVCLTTCLSSVEGSAVHWMPDAEPGEVSLTLLFIRLAHVQGGCSEAAPRCAGGG